MFDVVLNRRARSYLRRVDVSTARLLEECFADLAVNPFGGNRIKRLVGRGGEIRYRVGDLRVVYTVDRRTRVVTVVDIGPRGQIYRRRR